MKGRCVWLFICFGLYCFSAVTIAQSELTLEQVVTGANEVREKMEIRSGEVFLTAIGNEEPTNTLAEAEEWMENEMAKVKKEIEDGVKAGLPRFAEQYSRDAHFQHIVRCTPKYFKRALMKSRFRLKNRWHLNCCIQNMVSLARAVSCAAEWYMRTDNHGICRSLTHVLITQFRFMTTRSVRVHSKSDTNLRIHMM